MEVFFYEFSFYTRQRAMVLHSHGSKCHRLKLTVGSSGQVIQFYVLELSI